MQKTDWYPMCNVAFTNPRHQRNRKCLANTESEPEQEIAENWFADRFNSGCEGDVGCVIACIIQFLYHSFPNKILHVYGADRYITRYCLHPVSSVSLLIDSEGRPAMSDVFPMSPPCLESLGCHLTPLYSLLPCSSAYSHCSFCLVFFLPTGPFSGLFFRKFVNIFVKIWAF